MVAENFTWPYNWRLLSRVNIPTPTFNEIAAFGPHALLGSYRVVRSFCRHSETLVMEGSLDSYRAR